MIFGQTSIADVFVIAPEPVSDDRGHFARWYCAEEFAAHGLEPLQAQGGLSRNIRRGTLRGLHFIPGVDGEAKLVRCVAGSVFDVVVDVRLGSPTYGQWVAETLNSKTHNALYIPRGCAHGFMTLEDHVDVSYMFSRPFRAGIEQGIRWDDPDLAIHWPGAPVVLSQRDRDLPLLRDLQIAGEE